MTTTRDSHPPFATTEEIVKLHGDPVWEAIWSVVKTWDINTPRYTGYCSGTGDHATEIFRAIRSASQAGGVPAGWKLVPVEPTQAMLDAANRSGFEGSEQHVRQDWSTMLSASPPPPATDHAGWQDISTAPKDGTYVDIWGVNPAGRRFPGVRWTDWPPVGAVDGFTWRDERGVPVVDHADAVATNWMALPSAPGAPPPATDGDALREALEPILALPDACVNSLTQQRQIDMDGSEVGVSRQAVDEIHDALTKTRNALASSPPLAAAESEGLVQATVQGNGSVIVPVRQWRDPADLPELDDSERFTVYLAFSDDIVRLADWTAWTEYGPEHHGSTGVYLGSYPQDGDALYMTADGFDVRKGDDGRWSSMKHHDDGTKTPFHVTAWIEAMLPLPPPPTSDDRTNGSEAQSGSLNHALPASLVSATDAVEAERAIRARGTDEVENG